MAEKELSKKLGEVEVDGLVTAIEHPHTRHWCGCDPQGIQRHPES